MKPGHCRVSLALVTLAALGWVALLPAARAQKPITPPAETPAAKRETDEHDSLFHSVAQLEKRIAQLKAKGKARREAHQKKEKRDGRKPAREDMSKLWEHEGDGTEFLEAYLYYYQQRAYPKDYVNWNAWRRAAAHRDRMPAARWGSGDSGEGIDLQALGAVWSFMGPKNLPVPYTIFFGEGRIAGRVNAVAYDPFDTDTYYIGAANGGVWKSTNRGSTWTPLSDKWPMLRVSAIALDPKNQGTIYVGTGDFDGGDGPGFGLMRSKDGGATWINLGKAEFGNDHVSAIVVDPEDPNIVTVATGRGSGGEFVWRSTNGGEDNPDGTSSWTPVILDENGDPVDADWSDLEISAKESNGTRYYYAVGHSTGGEFWRSSDRGATWTRMNRPIAVNFFYNCLEIAASPTAPRTVYLIYNQAQGSDGKVFRGGIFKSTNRGDDWTGFTANFPHGVPFNDNYNWSQSNFDVHLTCSTRTVNGSKQDVLYAGLITLAQAPSGGDSWRDIGETYNPLFAHIHNDQHAMAINPENPNEALIGNDGGVYRFTYEPDTDARTFVSLNKNLAITEFNRMDAHPSSIKKMLGGAYHNATPVSTGDLANWINRAGGDGGFCAINPKEPNKQYATYQDLHVFRTTDGWANSSEVTPDTGSDRKAFYTPIALAPSQPHLLYAATNFLWRRDENNIFGLWDARLGEQQISSSGVALCLAVAPSNSNRIYTGSNTGEIWMTDAAGAAGSWTRIDGRGGNSGTVSLPNLAITSIAVRPTNSRRIYVALGGGGDQTGHLWRCDDTTAGSARTWIDISGPKDANGNPLPDALPDIMVNDVELDPDDPTNTIYVATDVGVFMTTDGGQHWANATRPLGLPNARVNDLKIVAGTRKIYAATFGRGIWRADLPAKITPASVTLNPALVAGGVSSVGTVTLNAVAPVGGTLVTLSSTDTVAATVPASVTVPFGSVSATFNINTVASGSTHVPRIRATAGGTTREAILTVHPPIASVSLPSSVVGGLDVTNASVTLQGVVSSNVTVTLSSNRPKVAYPSTSSIVVAANSMSRVFTLKTKPVASDTVVTITASFGGMSRSGTITIKRPTASSVTFSPSTVTGGGPTAKGTVTLAATAMVNTSVSLSVTSGSSVVQSIPASVTVLAGSNTATFNITTKKVSSTTSVQVQATANGGSATGTLTVRPPVPKSVTFTPGIIEPGESSIGTVTLDVAPIVDTSVSLSIVSGGTGVTMPTTVTVKAGSTTGSFPVRTSPSSGPILKVRATAHGVSKDGTLVIGA